MKRLLITGCSGFLGKNTMAALSKYNEYELITLNRNSSNLELKKSVLSADFIVHLAGVTKGKNYNEFYDGNTKLTNNIVSILRADNKNTPILMTSSIHADLDTPYGITKKLAEDVLIKYSTEFSVPIYIFRLEHLFGKWSKPNYNTVITTLCYNVANNLDIHIDNPHLLLDFVYVEDVVCSIKSCIDYQFSLNTSISCFYKINDYYYKINKVYKKTLSDIVDLLNMFKNMRSNLMIPDLSNDFNNALYLTFLSYLDSNSLSISLPKKNSNSQCLIELIKSNYFGKIYLDIIGYNKTIENHTYNNESKKIILIKGSILVQLKNLDSNKLFNYKLDKDNIKMLDIPIGYSYYLKNLSNDESLILVWSSKVN